MRVDVVDLRGCNAGVLHGVRHRSRRVLSRGVWLRDVSSIGGEAIADQFGVDMGASALRTLEFLKHDYRSSFAHHEAITLSIEWSGNTL